MTYPTDWPDAAPAQGEASASRNFTGDRRNRRLGTTRAWRAMKAEHAAERTRLQAFADWLTRLASSTAFLVSHVVWFGGWFLWNAGLFGLPAFDPYPFGLLTMIVSLEAIFLSIFVLMGQEREAQIAELREEVTLQVTLRIEEEVTKGLHLLAGLYSRLGHRLADDPELREMLQPLDAKVIEREMMEQIRAVRDVSRDNPTLAPPAN